MYYPSDGLQGWTMVTVVTIVTIEYVSFPIGIYLNPQLKWFFLYVSYRFYRHYRHHRYPLPEANPFQTPLKQHQRTLLTHYKTRYLQVKYSTLTKQKKHTNEQWRIKPSNKMKNLKNKWKNHLIKWIFIYKTAFRQMKKINENHLKADFFSLELRV